LIFELSFLYKNFLFLPIKVLKIKILLVDFNIFLRAISGLFVCSNKADATVLSAFYGISFSISNLVNLFFKSANIFNSEFV